jgi:O-antigen ligase
MIFMIPWEGVSVVSGLGTLSRLVGVLALAVWFGTVLVEGRIRRIVPFHLFVFLFFLWNATSIFWSLDVTQTFGRVMTYVRMVGLVLVIWNLYDTPSAVRMAMQAYVLGTFVPIFVIINNFLTGNSSGFDQRYAISGNDANTSGLIIALVIPLAWYLASSANEHKREPILRLVNFVFIPLAVFAVTLTATRFAMIMTIPAFIFGVWSFGRFGIGTRILVIVALSCGLFYLSTIVPEATFQRLSTADEEIAAGDFNGRSSLWKNGIELWSEHPLLGIGSAAFPRAVESIYGRPRSAHNGYVAVLAETGLIGFALFGAILAVVATLGWHLPKWESRLWLTMLVVLGLGNVIMTWTYNKTTWLLLSLLIVSVYALRQQSVPDPNPEPSVGSRTPSLSHSNSGPPQAKNRGYYV